MTKIIENVTLDIDGNMWHLNNGVCLSDPRSYNGFGATIQEAMDDFKHEFRIKAIGDLPLDMKPWVEGYFVGIDTETSNIQKIGYSHRLSQLLIEFNNGKRYHYLDVPVNIWQGLLIAPENALGALFNRIVKGNYRYTHVTGD